jgi:hypothetical protein
MRKMAATTGHATACMITAILEIVDGGGAGESVNWGLLPE